MKQELFDPEIITNTDQASLILMEGGLVAFPTETVYGLGANGLNQQAVETIFKAKRRPSNDPLILHVKDFQSVLPLVSESEEILNFCEFLSGKVWPGPLTLVLKKSEIVPDIICAYTGWVGVRCPNHKLTLELLSKIDFPLAGPSANLFGHVSPTTSQHVKYDFTQNDYKVWILEGGQCSRGIESTVVKVQENQESNQIELTILRQGSTTMTTLQQLTEGWSKVVKVTKTQFKPKEQTENKNFESPGLLLQHYSPKFPCFLFISSQFLCENAQSIKQKQSTTVLIDFGSICKRCIEERKEQFEFLQVLDLSEAQDLKQAEQNLYDILRKSEQVQNCSQILIYAGSFKDQNGCEAIWDRLYRAASGNVLDS